MMNNFYVLFLPALLMLTLAAVADDTEMKTETKPAASGQGLNKGPVLPADGTGKLPPSAKAPSAADQALRAKIRKKAPFWIDDPAHGAAIRLNKDGTFSSEAQGGGSTAGSWKALGGELHIQWSDGGEKYSYPVTGKGNEVLIRGQKAKKNRYSLN
jgi:hypothetical protein